MHQIIDVLQLGQTDGLEGGVDQTAVEELKGLGRVAAVAHIGALDGDHLDDGLEDGCPEVGAGGEADGYNCAAGSDVLLW
jgi:hypothetical protein